MNWQNFLEPPSNNARQAYYPEFRDIAKLKSFNDFYIERFFCHSRNSGLFLKFFVSSLISYAQYIDVNISTSDVDILYNLSST